MNTRKTGGLLAALLAGAIGLAACGDQQAEQDAQGGYAQGWQPGSYVPAPQNAGYAQGWQPGSYVPSAQGANVIVDSGIRAELAKQHRLANLPMDGWHGQLLHQPVETGADATQATQYRHRFL